MYCSTPVQHSMCICIYSVLLAEYSDSVLYRAPKGVLDSPPTQPTNPSSALSMSVPSASTLEDFFTAPSNLHPVLRTP